MLFLQKLADIAARLRSRIPDIVWTDNALALGDRAELERTAHAARRAFASIPHYLKTGWRQYGYYCALAALLCLLGAASVHYRSSRTDIAAAAIPTAEPMPTQISVPVITESKPAETESLLAPALGEILQGFSPDTLTWSETLQQWQTHGGTDFACKTGEAVYAIADGIVQDIYQDALFGGVIEILHENVVTAKYASLENTHIVKIGDAVARGDVIASAGSAVCESALGSHVHLELYRNGEPVDFFASPEQ